MASKQQQQQQQQQPNNDDRVNNESQKGDKPNENSEITTKCDARGFAPCTACFKKAYKLYRK